MSRSVGKRRSYIRIPHTTSVGILTQGKYYLLRSFDISKGGIGLTSHVPIEKGQMVIASFFPDSGNFIVCRAEVRSCSKTNTGYSIGLEFDNITFEDRRTIQHRFATPEGELLSRKLKNLL